MGIEISRPYSILFFMKETRLNNNNSSVVYTEIQCHLVPHLFICERELKTKKNKPVRYSINRKKTQIYENNKQHPNNHKDREIDDSIFCCSMIEKFFETDFVVVFQKPLRLLRSTFLYLSYNYLKN